ncbi:MAG: DUF4040 domain-containing protein [Akkermansiaceae bacterium]|nr:DUF4040 domain-containing protein [Akkermansiaceae bacterium]
MPLPLIIALPLVGALVAPAIVRMLGARLCGLILSLVPFSIAAWLLVDPAAGAAGSWSVPWLPALGIDFALRVAGPETLFLLLVSFIGGAILIYGGCYLAKDPRVSRFFVIILLFMASMLGVILADDMVVMFVFWELTSITSFLLIGFKHGDAGARKAALKALLVTGGGGLALLVGLVVLSQISGVTRLSQLPSVADTAAQSVLFPVAFLLILAGAFTKSAQVPFHFWLPGAMSAPTPVSAYLHSATMVKAGIILLVKLWPAFSGLPLWQWTITPAGAVTMLAGASMAILQTDLKRLLAYSTVSMLGAMTMLLGLGSPAALKAAFVLILAHGLYKAALFLVAGTIDHTTGTRDIRGLNGLGRSLPVLAVAGICATVSMSGFPPTLGFMSKELLLEAGLAATGTAWSIVIAGVIAGALGMAVAIASGVRPFFGPANERPLHLPDAGLIIPPLVLAALGILLALVPSYLETRLVAPAVTPLTGGGAGAPLSLWHGLTPALGLGILTLFLGFLLDRFRMKIDRGRELPRSLACLTPTAIYHSGMEGLLRLASWLTGWIQHGQLRIYVRVTLIAAAVLILHAVVLSKGRFSLASTVPVEPFGLTVLLLMSASAIAAARAQSRLRAILCLGGVGYSVALLFVAYGAPDLALTQLLVETLTVVLFSFIILKLPQIRIITDKRERGWDLLVACGAGVAMTLVVWKAVHVRVHDSISPGLVERSATEGFGLNVVNVILVDFRALDTLGEITVLALACLGVTALLAGRRRRGRPAHSELFNSGDETSGTGR